MSGWTILTLRGLYGSEYEPSQFDDKDPYRATADIVAAMEKDDRVRKWTTGHSHVYAYLNCPRYDFGFAENLMCDYSDMVYDAVVLGANDTTDTGTAKYYPRPNGKWTDNYHETQSEDGTFVGEMALCVINARHSIMAKDPFHNQCGHIDDRYLDKGTNRLQEEQQ